MLQGEPLGVVKEKEVREEEKSISSRDMGTKLDGGEEEEEERHAGDVERALATEGWHVFPGVALHILHQLSMPLQDATTRSVGGSRRDHNLLQKRVRATLSDLDLKDVGERCLPETQALRQMRRLRGPFVLQIATITNICESKAASSSKSSKSRLLRLQLSDGHATISAIEYRPIPSLSLDIPPGTKVRINDAALHSGVLLLDESVTFVVGGHVQSLYNAWKMDQTYSGLVRAAGRGSSSTSTCGPPPFRGLSVSSIGEPSTRPHTDFKLQDKSAETHTRSAVQHSLAKTISRSNLSHDTYNPSSTRVRPGSEPYRLKTNSGEDKNSDATDGKLQDKELHLEIDQKVDSSSKIVDGVESRDNEMEVATSSQATAVCGPTVSQNAQFNAGAVEIKSSKAHSEKGVGKRESIVAHSTDSMPAQNRMVAQKLLERRIHKDSGLGRREENHHSSRSKPPGGRRAGKERTEQQTVYTLDEWEAKQRTSSALEDLASSSRQYSTELSDEALARKLQQQLDFESLGVAASKRIDESEQLRLSMFKFPSERIESSSRERGRGRRGGRRHRF